MTEPACKSLREILADLEQVAPDAPALALGQTVFWDEPMKAGVALELRKIGSRRRLVAGVHDTDYFAKLPSGPRQPGRYRALPHNDTTTRGLWSAAAEFSTLFGSETVITREALNAAGLRTAALERARPNILDEATEAWGWQGIVSLDEAPPITAETPLRGLFPVLRDTLDWAVDAAVESVSGPNAPASAEQAHRLHALLCDEGDDQSQSLAQVYRKLLPRMYEFVANEPVDIDVTATTELLRFNASTATLPRFQILDAFVSQSTRHAACEAYNEAIRGGSGQYELPRFGTGAIPFDIVIPGVGRGTIRIGNRGVVFMTRKPQFLSLRKPLESAQELAELIEQKFGPNCAVVGKAVALIGMLAREFVFVFHEGASNYVRHSRRLADNLRAQGHDLPLNPILRIRYETWDALRGDCAWFRLPEPFRRAFGTEELCGPSLAARWRQVGVEQEAFLAELGRLRRPIELIRYLDEALGGSWRVLADEYASLQSQMESVRQQLEALKAERVELYKADRRYRVLRVESERALGEHWRAKIFEREPTEADLAERHRLQAKVAKAIEGATETRRARIELRHRQNAIVQSEEMCAIHERRRTIELEAELKRMRLIRDAIVSSKGLKNANHRPSAWWFPLVCPDGKWFRSTIQSAQAYLEPL